MAAVTDDVRAQRVAALLDQLATYDAVVVAFSGGADSAFLLAAAVRALGRERVTAATAVSPSLPHTELDQARRFADELGVRHLTPGTDELSREGYRANGADRCYFCKAELLDTLAPLVVER
ncbi:MAG: ExsB family transcriptional regulator, partial [Geodermatophilaceae bacterium]|nr:ExsB family transcriptional regulator [Geodermatophilaceae bacterium]